MPRQLYPTSRWCYGVCGRHGTSRRNGWWECLCFTHPSTTGSLCVCLTMLHQWHTAVLCLIFINLSVYVTETALHLRAELRCLDMAEPVPLFLLLEGPALVSCAWQCQTEPRTEDCAGQFTFLHGPVRSNWLVAVDNSEHKRDAMITTINSCRN